MIKKNNGEIWKQLQFKGWKQLRKKYAVSSHGRVASYKEDIVADGKLLEGSLTSGYKTLNLHINGTNGTIYFHREVAKLFNKKNSLKETISNDLINSKIKNQNQFDSVPPSFVDTSSVFSKGISPSPSEVTGAGRQIISSSYDYSNQVQVTIL